jgi:hypothetical protein
VFFATGMVPWIFPYLLNFPFLSCQFGCIRFNSTGSEIKNYAFLPVRTMTISLYSEKNLPFIKKRFVV